MFFLNGTNHSCGILVFVTGDLAFVLKSSIPKEQRHGPSYWKFKASLLDDHDFVELIAERVPIWREEFTEVNDKRIFWDLNKYRIRQVTIKFSEGKLRPTQEGRNLKSQKTNCLL